MGNYNINNFAELAVPSYEPAPFASAYEQLNAVERAFVDAYTAVLDPRLAARSARPKARPETLARHLLVRPMVKAAIAEVFAMRRQRYAVDLERLKQELAAIAFASHSDYMRLGTDGEPYYDLSGVSPEAMAAVAEITVEDYVEGRGENARDVRKIRLKLHDKISAINALAKIMGAVAPDQINVNLSAAIRSETNVNVNMTVQDAADMYARTLHEE